MRAAEIQGNLADRADSAISFHSGYSGLVATVSGSQQTLVVALNSDLANPGQVASGSFSEAVNASNGQVRVWRSGSGDGGGNDGGEGGLGGGGEGGG